MDRSTDKGSKDKLHQSNKSSAAFLLKEFTESTTLHGIRSVFGDGSRIRRLTWCLCLLSCSTVFVLNLWQLVVSFLSYDVVTRVSLVSEEQVHFPAVTICNFNPMRKTYVESMNLTQYFSWKSFESSLLEENHLDNFDLDDLINTLPSVDEKVPVIFASPFQDVLRDAGHKMESEKMFVSCRFHGKKCTPKDFKSVFTRMGQCYTFNKDTNNTRFERVTKPGDDFGLRLLLNVEQHEYFGFTSEQAGFKVHIHHPDEPPLIKENGFAVMPGSATFVAIIKERVKSLPAPYKTKCENKKLPGTSVYSKPLCQEACRALFIMKTCGCRDADMPEIPDINVPQCTLGQKYNCVATQEEELTKQRLKNCSCPTPCDLTSYHTRLSYAQFPSEHTKSSLAEIYRRRKYIDYSTDYMYDYMGKNYVRIKIFLQDLNYQLIEDLPKYPIQSLFAEAGGMLGLLLGASIITLVEFIEFLLSLISLQFHSKRKEVTRINVQQASEK